MSEEELSEKLEIFISARNLNFTNSSSNSFVVVELAEGSKPKRKVLETKVCSHEINPNYPQSLIINFVFESIFFLTHSKTKTDIHYQRVIK